MSVITGKDAFFKIKSGSASASSKVGYVNNYSLTINSASIDITSLGDLWRVFKGDLRVWSVSATAAFDLTDANDKALFDMLCGEGTVSAVELHMGVGDHEFVGDAIITSAPVSATVGDKVSVNYSFQGSGTLELKEVV